MELRVYVDGKLCEQKDLPQLPFKTVKEAVEYNNFHDLEADIEARLFAYRGPYSALSYGYFSGPFGTIEDELTRTPFQNYLEDLPKELHNEAVIWDCWKPH